MKEKKQAELAILLLATCAIYIKPETVKDLVCIMNQVDMHLERNININQYETMYDCMFIML